MQCEQVRPWLNDYAEGTLPPYKAAWVSQHLGWCSECAAQISKQPPRRAAAESPLPQPQVISKGAAAMPRRTSSRAGKARRWLRRTATLSLVAAAALFLASRLPMLVSRIHLALVR